MNTATQRAYGARARVALLVPSPNTVAETEFWRMAPPGVSIHTSRMPYFPERDGDPFPAMEAEVPRVLAEATSAEPTVVAYGCTASSAKGDPDAKEQALSEEAGLPTVTAAAALLAALAALGASRIALVTPYPQHVNDKERLFFADNGVDVVADQSLIVDKAQERLKKMYRVPPEMVIERAVALGADPRVEAIVLSCCDMPTLDAIPAIEQQTGKPVASSTQALFWRSLRAAGVNDPVDGAGRLLTHW